MRKQPAHTATNRPRALMSVAEIHVVERVRFDQGASGDAWLAMAKAEWRVKTSGKWQILR